MKKTEKRYLGICIVLLGLTRLVNAQSVTIDMDSVYQSISGFGGVNMPGWIEDLSEDLVDKAFGNDPGQIGLTILRIRVPNDTTQFYREVPTAVLAKNQGVTIMGSPWSPPASLKSNNNLVGGYLLPENYGAYADHLLGFATYMNNNGASLHSISIQNEPDVQVDYESCDWYASQMIEFLEEQGSRFDTLKIIAPESFQFRRLLSDSILNDPEAEQHVDIIGGHIYGGGLFDYPLAREQGKEVWMTEHLTGSSSPEANTWLLALALSTEITDCMKANFNAYVWWYIRRFYGLITDDGNISKKGYVISQFTKFIRPGAVRVNAIPDALPGVDATAYKTDTSLIIVVVNNNSTEVSLDFTIQNNSGIDTLTQLTTSETKNVENQGGISITADAFSATVDSKSITTFTSHAGMGGKFNNVPPVAYAGEDIEVDDLDGNSVDTILLDGSGSTDSDGTIINYSWSFNGQHLGWEDSIIFAAPIGEHVAVLTVTDDDGATHSDTLNIIINTIFNTALWFESECGQVGSTWEIHSDNNASNGEYITTPAGTELIDGPSSDPADQLVISFQVDEIGLYKVWGRVITPNANDDSFWVQVDASSWAMWNSIPASSAWHWDDVHDGGNDNPVDYDLEAGEHTLRICYREDGALLDKIYISNTGIIPTGLGEVDETCPDIPDLDNSAKPFNELQEMRLYPNPASDKIHINWSIGYTTLMLVGIDGRTMFQKDYAAPVQNVSLDMNLESGMYFILLSNKETRVVSKLIIE